MSLEPYDPENPPAFPVMVKTPNGTFPEGGMSLRDYFAAQAITASEGLLRAAIQAGVDFNTDDMTNLVAGAAYELADAMMQARKPKQPTEFITGTYGSGFEDQQECEAYYAAGHAHATPAQIKEFRKTYVRKNS